MLFQNSRPRFAPLHAHTQCSEKEASYASRHTIWQQTVGKETMSLPEQGRHWMTASCFCQNEIICVWSSCQEALEVNSTLWREGLWTEHRNSLYLTQEACQSPHVLLHQRVHLLLREAPNAMAVHFPLHDSFGQMAKDPLQQVAEGTKKRNHLLRLMKIFHPLAIS